MGLQIGLRLQNGAEHHHLGGLAKLRGVHEREFQCVANLTKPSERKLPSTQRSRRRYFLPRTSGRLQLWDGIGPSGQ